MKRKFLIAVLIAASVLAAGCAAEAPSATEPVAPEVGEPKAAAEPEPPKPEFTVPENDMGLINASVADLEALVKGGESFILFLSGGEDSPYDYEGIKAGFDTLNKEYEVQCGLYYADESILTDYEYEVLKGLLNTEPTMLFTEDGAEGVSTYSGLYAFENGAVKNVSHNLLPSGETYYTKFKVINFIYESDLFVNDHGFEIVTYEQLKDKINSGEKFMVYISRDTCPYCVPFAQTFLKALEKYPNNVPIYYFYTQSFKSAINREEKGAKEAWESVKADVGFGGTPALLVFENGVQSLSFDGQVDDDYIMMSDEGKQAQKDALLALQEQWLVEKGLTDVK